MCTINGSKYLSLPFFAACLTIVLESALIALQIYSYHQRLVNVIVDEIFLVITVIFLVFSICWLFVSSRDFFYSHFRLVRGFQAVVMITNGGILILSAFRIRDTEECQQIENSGVKCQNFEIRIIIGSMAILDGLLYFCRRPITFTKGKIFYPQSVMSMKTQAEHEKVIKRKSQRQDELNGAKMNISNHMLINVESDFDCILKVEPQRRQSQQSQVNYMTDHGHGKNIHENEGHAVDSLAEIMNMNVSRSPNSFYYNYDNQEYFLPNVQVISPKTSRYNQDRCSTLTRDGQKDGFD